MLSKPAPTKPCIIRIMHVAMALCLSLVGLHAAEPGAAVGADEYAKGVAFYRGDGVERNDAEAAAWLTKAADKGNTAAPFALAVIYSNGGVGLAANGELALRWLRRGVDVGDPNAQYLFGQGCEGGMLGKPDPSAAVQWYRKAAEQNHMDAQREYGRCLALGVGVDADPAASVEWFTKAAKLGDAKSMYFLGFLHAQGSGVKVDNVEAYRWMLLAKEHGNQVADKAVADFEASLAEKDRVDGRSRAQQWKDAQKR
jgi:TPR repeat protein